MAKQIKFLNGATETIVARLKEKDISDNEQLLKAGAGPGQRKTLADHCGCNVKEILELTNRADLARIKGVAGIYSHLLERAGVDTAKELATRRADNLHSKIISTNGEEQLTERPPSISVVGRYLSDIAPT
jgi:hypothetical protein